MLIPVSTGVKCDRPQIWRNSDAESRRDAPEFGTRLPPFFAEGMRSRQCLAEMC